ncbi:MAG: tetratricopeptide repeat protein [Candidatus Hydrogenedentales bacterium]
MDARHAEQLYKQADALFRQGDFRQALQLLETLNAEFPDNRDTLYAQARCLIALGRAAEARKAVEYLIDFLGAPRGRSLLPKLEALERGEISPPQEVPKTAPVPVQTAPIPARSQSLYVRLAILAVIGTAVLVLAINYVRRIDAPGSAARPTTDAELRQYKKRVAPVREELERERNLAREDLLQKQRAVLLAEAKMPATKPGQVHPAEQWKLTAIDGVPDWKPGIYQVVPCKGNSKYTIDVYIPMAYQERPTDFFPGLMISMPGGNPGFQGFADYAESVDMLIVAINNSTNDTYKFNKYAQELAFATILPSLRLDQRLGFTFGASGGARTNWDCMCGQPQFFAGLLQVAFGTPQTCDFPRPGARVVFLYGQGDFNADSTAIDIRRLRNAGFEVVERVYAGDHGTPAPQQDRVELMDWLVSSARRDLGLPHPP